MSRFSYRRTLLLGLGFFGITLITSLYDALLPLILEGFGIAASLIGFVMTFDNYAALFLQPWAGARSDQTRTRLGRRIPFILIGAPLGALGFSLIPLMPTFALLLGAVLLTNLAMAFFRSPTIALLGDIFPSEQRSQANGVINFMGTLAGALALFAGGALFRQARALPFWTASLGMLVALSLLILLVKEARRIPEGVEPEQEPGLLANLREVLTAPDKSALLVLLAIFCWTAGQNSVQTFFTLFATNVLGLEGGRATQMLTLYAGAGLVFAIPGGLIAARYGRRRVVMVCLVILTLLFLGAFFVVNTAYVLVMLVLAGAAFTTIIVNALTVIPQKHTSRLAPALSFHPPHPRLGLCP